MRIRKKVINLLMMSALIPGIFSCLQATAMEELIAKGDVLRIIVKGHDEISQAVLVDSQGMIRLPLVGKIEAEGLTLKQLKDRIAEELGKYYRHPKVAVESGRLGEKASLVAESSINILGQVKSPGAYPIDVEIPFLDALALAKGLSAEADLNRAKVVRGPSENYRTISVKILENFQNGNQGGFPKLKPGDSIYVPRKAGNLVWKVIGRISTIAATATTVFIAYILIFEREIIWRR